MHKPIYVHAEWDPEANVWFAESRDVPGLATEASTVELLMHKLAVMIPEMLEANGADVPADTAFELLARRFEMARPAA
jgi:predicted RNase H-like HicB family nuclease